MSITIVAGLTEFEVALCPSQTLFTGVSHHARFQILSVWLPKVFLFHYYGVGGIRVTIESFSQEN